MIGKLKGKIDAIGESFLIVDVNGVGYEVQASARTLRNLKIGDAVILASDGECKGKPSFQGFSLTITANDDAHAEKLFTALGNGGQVTTPLMETFFASRFGMVDDQFGVNWIVLAEKKPA